MLDLDAVRDRWAALGQPGAVAALRAEREAQIVSERWMESDSEEHRPEPYFQQQLGRAAGRPLDGPAASARRLGLDADGRVVLAQLLRGGREARCDLLTWTAETVELLVSGPEGELGELRVLAFAGARALELAATRGVPRLDGRPALEVVLYDYDGRGRLALALEVSESGAHRSWGGPEKGPYWQSTATRFTHNAAGELTLVEHVVVGQELAHGQGVAAALEQAHALVAAGGSGVSVVYDARVSARVNDLPAPELAFEGLAGRLADALLRAADSVRDRVGVPSTGQRTPAQAQAPGARRKTPQAMADSAAASACTQWPARLPPLPRSDRASPLRRSSVNSGAGVRKPIT